VPVLDHDGRLINESSVICEYLDGVSAHNPLMPADPVARARTRTWGVYTLEYHDSVNTLTFSSYQRQMLLAKSPEELEARWKSIPDPIKVRKLKDLVANGAGSDYVPVALGKLARMCAEMDAALAHGDWLMGDQYSLADALVTPYFYRIDCIGLSGLWEPRYPRTTAWFDRVSQRTSLAAATGPWLDTAEIERIRAIGTDTFVAGGRFSDYL
jgi:glutathione S-transferase